MTDDHSTDTGQISVAELLARNGQKVGSRSGGRRRRGNTGGISVAELTGEIPVVGRAARTNDGDSGTGDTAAATPPTPTVEPLAQQTPRVEPPVLETPKVEPTVPETPKVEPPVLDTPKPPSAAAVVSDATANEMTRVTSPAPVADPPTTVAEVAKIESPTEIIRPSALPRRARAHLDTVSASTPPPAPVRSTDGPEPRLLSGPASDLRGTGSDDDAAQNTDTIDPAADDGGSVDASVTRTPRDSKSRDGDKGAGGKSTGEKGKAGKVKAGAKAAASATEDAEATDGEPPRDGSSDSGVRQWALLIGESVGAIVAGGLLFKGFEKLWDMMPWVAFGLALVVIVGLVAVVRILRRTDDIMSQLIALAVGAFVAFGPLLFLLPNG
ncbi:hypothetical protein [Rhodococcus yananensis]|uniref:hypothetical protein n=1 Tax=Rhodococcus yananensis TaxID=2879464 RepID=UPI001CF8E1F7|nr:hypothetical protein [Rhodococcus yananensis]